VTDDQQNLINNNLDLISAVVHNELWRFPGLEREDLLQEGFLALQKAATHYNPDLGPFGTYAYTCIIRRLYLFRDRERRNKFAHHMNIDDLCHGTNGRQEQAWVDYELDLDDALSDLNDIDPTLRDMFALRFRDGLTLREIGDEFGVSAQRVEQQLKRAETKSTKALPFAGPGPRKRRHNNDPEANGGT
jgi:RNA polymerase sigma factor (sigma-70 family)